MVVLELPVGDSLLDKKLKLLKERGLKLEFLGDLSHDQCCILDDMMRTARMLELNETELYFLEDDERGMLSPRNEMAALSLIRSALLRQGSLTDLLRRVEEKLDEFGAGEESVASVAPCNREPEAALLRWAKDQGLKTNVYITDFEGYGRGAAAASGLQPGDLVLEAPKELLIDDDVVFDSDVGRYLSRHGSPSSEIISLLWSIKQRNDTQSKFAPYFASLPDFFHTGLSFGTSGLQELAGLTVFEQIMQAKEHLRRQYDSLFPMLSDREPELFPRDIYTWESFLWASELWYSNSLKVGYPDGKVRTCLVPVLGLLNHSIVPHITRYSKLDPASNSLKVFSLRSCKAGRQCFLSYGALPNSDFLCFYGFVPDNNPYDTIPIEFEMPEEDSCRGALVQRYDVGGCHMVRAGWLSTSALTRAGVPTKLLAALRVAVMEEEEAESFNGDPRHTVVNEENERVVMEALASTFEALLPEDSGCEDCDSWDFVLAKRYKSKHVQLIRSLL